MLDTYDIALQAIIAELDAYYRDNPFIIFTAASKREDPLKAITKAVKHRLLPLGFVEVTLEATPSFIIVTGFDKDHIKHTLRIDAGACRFRLQYAINNASHTKE